MSNSRKHVEALHQCKEYSSLYCYVRDQVKNKDEAQGIVPYYVYIGDSPVAPIILELLDLFHLNSSRFCYDHQETVPQANHKKVVVLQDGYLDRTWLEIQLNSARAEGQDIFNVFDQTFRLIYQKYPAIGEHIVRQCVPFLQELTQHPGVWGGLTQQYPWGHPVWHDEQIMLDHSWEQYCSEVGVLNNIAHFSFHVLKTPIDLHKETERWQLLQYLNHLHEDNISVWLKDVQGYIKDRPDYTLQIVLSHLGFLSLERQQLWLKHIPVHYLREAPSRVFEWGVAMLIAPELQARMATLVQDIEKVLHSGTGFILEQEGDLNKITWNHIQRWIEPVISSSETSLHW